MKIILKEGETVSIFAEGHNDKSTHAVITNNGGMVMNRTDWDRDEEEKK